MMEKEEQLMTRKNDILDIYTKEVESIREAGLFKGEAPFISPQGARVTMEDGRELLCMCANNYLGPVSYTHLDVYKRQQLWR